MVPDSSLHTCGTTPLWQLLQIFVFPPVFCVLLAFFLLIRRPGTFHIWAFSACLLAMSQLDLFPQRLGFQWTANTMAWTGWFRIAATFYRAFVQNIWPAALVTVASYLFPVAPAIRKWSRYFAIVLLAYCLMQCVLSLAWSEYYLPFIPLYRWFQQHRVERLAITFIATACLCFLHNRALGIIVFALAVLASSVFYGPSDAVAPAFATLAVLLLLAFEFRSTTRRVSISLLLLLAPMLYVLAIMNGNITLAVTW